ncbi:MAG: chromosome segregation protein SMC [Alphaproteobacteria bacterium]|nr:chromosome segregation protein SMC [Alphaproteobacteria bacterium]
MEFNKLRLTGFKSFVDGTDLEIAPGLTGIVGPNGCGKSNLVEALRWVMGETSAKQMRGGGMDDVIFGGTTDRPARNAAEVVLSLDNAGRTAPSQFNESDDLEVSRRIEREKGSTYRVNGSDVRARDVQILFADQATGPRSTALVSQGRVGALIAAKPGDRRLLLEEAAGITGLHSRRHEAELRLRAAEGNLERLDDVLVTLDAQLQGLKKQVRQARRYKNISHDIRRTEAAVLHHRWVQAQEAVSACEEQLRAAETVVAEQARLVSQTTRTREESAAALVPLRDAEAAAAAELQRLNIAREELDAEERRAQTAMEQWQTRLTQIEADLGRERSLAGEAKAALDRLGTEKAQIEQACTGEDDLIAETNAARETRSARVQSLESELTQLMERLANGEAQIAALERELGELDARRRRLDSQASEARVEREAIEEQGLTSDELVSAEAQVTNSEEALKTARAALETADTTREAAESQRDKVRDIRAQSAEALSRLRAEAGALEDVLANDAETEAADWTPMIDEIEVTHGYEAALGAALGEDLDAPMDSRAPRHWNTSVTPADDPALPAGTRALSEFVSKSGALGRRLAQIGVVDNAEAGARLVSTLKPGQRLVDRDGQLWRWDGYVASGDARSSASTRLRQRNRLVELGDRIAAAETAFERIDSDFATAKQNADAAIEAARAARSQLDSADNAASQARRSHANLSSEFAARIARHESLTETLTRIEGEVADVEARLTDARARRTAIGDLDEIRSTTEGMRGQLSEARNALSAAQSEHDRLVREAEERHRRISALAAEETSWQARHTGAGERIGELETREGQARSESQALSAKPAEIEALRSGLMNQLNAAEAKRNEAGDAVARADERLSLAERAMRDAEAKLATMREDKVRTESAVAQAGQILQTVIERIEERLECKPEAVLPMAEVAEGKELPDLESSDKRLERLLRERDNMGPVNLRAEQESEELEEKIETINTEREDLVAAIDRLRRGIASLNREARQRLLASFKEVDKHFQDLFVRLFGGGRAHLELTDAEDPLEAGIEIYASPPGKKLQILSLLSGGEQALTATALLFAVFLTNPAPICVLDEVDAPLDDANVDRFCTLLDYISQIGTTRFLIVTHHRMTMARMDRLYGVTMPERGVSQLVSVDLRGAEEIRAIA